MEYRALYEPEEDGGFVITFPDFGWGVSQGDNEEEAREMAAALLQTLVQEHIRQGKALPAPRRRRGKQFRSIRLPALQGAKAELYNAFRDSGIRKAELARRLGISKGNVERLFNLSYHSRMDQMEAAFRAIGKEIEIAIRNAA